MWDWIFYLFLAAILLGGLYITLLNLPGLWVMVAATMVYAIITHFAYASVKTLVAILVLAMIAEAIDFVAGAAGAKRAGGSKRGFIGAMVGGILGGIFLTFIPIPIISTIIGIILGTFIGAIIGELWGGAEVTRSLRIGAGAAWGRLLGILTKLLFGCAIFATVMIAGHPPFHRPKTSANLHAPVKVPATSPANVITASKIEISRAPLTRYVGIAASETLIHKSGLRFKSLALS